MANKKNGANVAIRRTKSNPARNKVSGFMYSELCESPRWILRIELIQQTFNECRYAGGLP